MNVGLPSPPAFAKWFCRWGIGPLVVGFGWQKIHFVIGGDAHDLGRIGEVVKFVEERFQFCMGATQNRARAGLSDLLK